MKDDITAQSVLPAVHSLVSEPLYVLRRTTLIIGRNTKQVGRIKPETKVYAVNMVFRSKNLTTCGHSRNTDVRYVEPRKAHGKRMLLGWLWIIVTQRAVFEDFCALLAIEG